MEYTIIQSVSQQTIINLVNTKLKEGWHIVGGVSTSEDVNYSITYVQAMVKIDEK